MFTSIIQIVVGRVCVCKELNLIKSDAYKLPTFKKLTLYLLLKPDSFKVTAGKSCTNCQMQRKQEKTLARISLIASVEKKWFIFDLQLLLAVKRLRWNQFFMEIALYH